MLFVWLFAWVSGVANACLLDPQRDHAQGLQQSQVTPEAAAMGVDGHHTEGVVHHTQRVAPHAVGVATHDDDSDSMPSKESCLKACDAGSQSVLKHAASFDLVDPGLPHIVTAAWTAPTRMAPTPGREADFRLPDRGPPIRVLFSRLAL